MLIQLIKETLPGQDFTFYSKVYDLCLFYSVGHYNAFAFQRKLTLVLAEEGIKCSAKQFRLKLCENSYFLFNLKFFALNYVVRKLSYEKNKLTLKKVIQTYSIEPSDYYYFSVSTKKKGHRKILTSVFESNTLEDIITVNQAKKQFQDLHSSIMSYIRHITYKKLSFIIRSNNMCVDDMHCELMAKALRAYYTLLPCKGTPLYIQNYIKRVVHNHAMNVIAKYTFQKRTRLVNIGGAFVLNTTSENQLRCTSDGELVSLESLGESHEKGYDIIDYNSTVKSLLKRYTKKRRKFLILIFGKYDESFTRYLHESKKISADCDNTDYYDKSITDYKKQACMFLKVSTEAGDTFLRKIHKYHFC